MNDWTFNGEPYTETPPEKEYMGFVYLITNKIDGRKYIGKKIFWTRARKSINGKIKRVRVESDWKKYHGSGPSIKADVEKLRPENFDRQILHLCKTKSEANYLEAWEQFTRNVLLDDAYYNDWISARVTARHLQKVRHRLEEATHG